MDWKNIIQKAKNTQWEKMPREIIESYRDDIRQVKSIPGIEKQMREILRQQLTGRGGHAQDNLAVRIFNHYLLRSGNPLILSLPDIKYIMTYRVNIKKIWGGNQKSSTSKWDKSIKEVKSHPRITKFYSGKSHNVMNNGAIAKYTTYFHGLIFPDTDEDGIWKGFVRFYDRFDLDPHWDWATSRKRSRTAGGERRTRIGYMLDLGKDFDIHSNWVQARQRSKHQSIRIGKITYPFMMPTPPLDDVHKFNP